MSGFGLGIISGFGLGIQISYGSNIQKVTSYKKLSINFFDVSKNCDNNLRKNRS